MNMIGRLFLIFDETISKFNCQKLCYKILIRVKVKFLYGYDYFLTYKEIETIGDAYFAVSGCPEPNKNHALEIARFALAIRQKYVLGKLQFIKFKYFLILKFF